MRLYGRRLFHWIMASGLFYVPALATAHAPHDAMTSVAERQIHYTQGTPNGFQTGSVTWQPAVEARYAYSDNIRATPTHRAADHIVMLAPSLQFQTDNPDTGLNGMLQVRQLSYARHQSQNQSNGTARLSPYYYIGSGWHGTSTLAMTYEHELPTSESNQPLADDPTPYRQLHADSDLRHDRGLVAMALSVSYDRLTFGNTDLLNGQRSVNDDRNRNDLAAGAEIWLQSKDRLHRLGWKNEILQQNFTRADFNTVSGQYNGLKRDNDGGRSTLTFSTSPTHLLRMTGAIGAERRSFEQSQWHDKTALVGQARVIYLMTPITNLTLDLKRSVETTAFETAPAFTSQSIQVGIDHELRCNVVLNLSFQHSTADYWDNPRDDTTVTGRIGVSYRQNRHMQWQAGYHYQERNSSLNTADYAENRFTIGTRIEF